MLPKRLRLPIQEVVGKKGRAVFGGDFFTIKSFPNNHGFSRFGVIISKKVGKTAVIRNRVKRAIFDAVVEIKNSWPVADYLIITNQAIIGLEVAGIKQEFLKV